MAGGATLTRSADTMARKSRPLKDYESAYRGRVAGLTASAVATLLYLLVNSAPGGRVRARAEGGRERSAGDWRALLGWAAANAARAGVDAEDAQAVEAWAESLLTVTASARQVAQAFGRASSNTGAKRLAPLVEAGILRKAAGASGRRAPLWVFEPVEFSAVGENDDGEGKATGDENGGDSGGAAFPDWF